MLKVEICWNKDILLGKTMHSAEMVIEVVCAVFLAERYDSPTLQTQRHQNQGGGECDAPLPEGTAETLQVKMNGDAALLTVAETPALKEAAHKLIK